MVVNKSRAGMTGSNQIATQRQTQVYDTIMCSCSYSCFSPTLHSSLMRKRTSQRAGTLSRTCKHRKSFVSSSERSHSRGGSTATSSSMRVYVTRVFSNERRDEKREGHVVVCGSTAAASSTQLLDQSGDSDAMKDEVKRLREVARLAAEAGAGVVSDALNANTSSVIEFKGASDLVTETDTASEAAILNVIRAMCPTHAILGEEGGVINPKTSQTIQEDADIGQIDKKSESEAADEAMSQFEYLWIVDPLDGTTNFAHRYPSFGVSVALLKNGKLIASSVVEFTGGYGCWSRRVFSAGKGIGASCNGVKIEVSQNELLQNSLLVTGFGYDHGARWRKNMELFKHFTDVTRGVRRLGAASVDLCHVGLGIIDGYWEFDCKAWDWSAGALVVLEAGGQLTNMGGEPWGSFNNSIVASNGKIHADILSRTMPVVDELRQSEDFVGDWHVPSGYPIEFLNS